MHRFADNAASLLRMNSIHADKRKNNQVVDAMVMALDLKILEQLAPHQPAPPMSSPLEEGT